MLQEEAVWRADGELAAKLGGYWPDACGEGTFTAEMPGSQAHMIMRAALEA